MHQNSHEKPITVYGAIASIVIGLILAAIAIFLAYESKSLLVGETVEKKTVEEIRKLVDCATYRSHPPDILREIAML